MAYPKFRYHAGLPPVQVRTVEEEANFPESAGWGDVYIRQDWPKQAYGPGGATQVAKDQAALDTLLAAGFSEQAPEMVPPSPATSAVADENVRLQAQIAAFQALEDNERLKAQLASLQAKAGARLEQGQPLNDQPQSPADASAQARAEQEAEDRAAASEIAQSRVIEPPNAGNGPSAAAVATAKRQADAEAKAAAKVAK